MRFVKSLAGAAAAALLVVGCGQGSGNDGSTGPSIVINTTNGGANNQSQNNGTNTTGTTSNTGNNGNGGTNNNGTTGTNTNGNGGTNNTTDTCVDNDGDGYFSGCADYTTHQGPDCNDNDPDNWTSCNTCVDGDSDGYFTGCDAYTTHQGPDCNDGNAAVNPGAAEIPGNGVDDDCNASTADAMCSSFPRDPMTDPEGMNLKGTVAEHNQWRDRVGVQHLHWNAALARSATAYAQKCIWQHDPNRSPDAGFSYVGDNLYAASGQPNANTGIDAVDGWASERADYDYGTPVPQTETGPMVGHYTQLVWKDSTDVGCGYAYCNSIQGLNFAGTIVDCRYGPGGNYIGQTPYDYTQGACLDLDNDDVRQGQDADDTDRTVQ